jgi:hypothetical protein
MRVYDRSHLLSEGNAGEETMKRLRIGLIVLAAWCVPLLEREVKAQSETPFNYARLSIRFYPESRLGYEALPVRVVGAGGGKLGAKEPFKVIAAAVRNATRKNVTAVKFSYFIFRTSDLGEVVEKGETALIPIDLLAKESRKVKTDVLNFENSPLFKDKSEDQYRIEVAVTEVHYDDGSIWRGTDLPQKMDPAKLP